MKYVISLLLLLLCFGCASTPPTFIEDTPPPSLIKHNWNMYGKLGITSPDGSLSLNFEWKLTQKGKKTHASFSTMMGILNSQIEFTDDMVRIFFVNGDVETMINDPEVIGRVLNKKFYLPLKEMNFWLIGEEAIGNLHNVVRNNDGTINTLQQAGWIINFDGYKMEKEYRIPKTLSLYNYSEKIRINIIVSGISIE